jgi:hypothetical protein
VIRRLAAVFKRGIGAVPLRRELGRTPKPWVPATLMAWNRVGDRIWVQLSNRDTRAWVNQALAELSMHSAGAADPCRDWPTHSPPEARENGRGIRGGRPWYQATDVRQAHQQRNAKTDQSRMTRPT